MATDPPEFQYRWHRWQNRKGNVVWLSPHPITRRWRLGWWIHRHRRAVNVIQFVAVSWIAYGVVVWRGFPEWWMFPIAIVALVLLSVVEDRCLR